MQRYVSGLLSTPRRLRALFVVLASVVLVLAGTSGASASSYYTGGSTGSIWNFTTGSTSYYQNHGNDDFAFDVTSGVAIDARWVSCSGSQTGSVKYNINAPGGYVVLGTNFLPTTCLHIQYRGYTGTGSFNGYSYWNYNFA